MNKFYANIEMRDAFFNELFIHASSNPNIILISNDFGAPSLDKFRNTLSDQFINAGISEQNIISVAAGLALKNKKVFIYSIASFITLRCLEQIKIDLCSMKLPVTILGVGPCYAYAEDGPTHHSTEDIAIMRSLANIAIYSPSDNLFVKYLVNETLHSNTVNYIRLERGKLQHIYNDYYDFSKGFSFVDSKSEITLISTGIMTGICYEIKQELSSKGTKVNLIDLYKIKPINIEFIIPYLEKSEIIISVEEHTINGGIGSIISEIITDFNLKVRLIRIAIHDNQLYTYGKRTEIQKERLLDKSSIIKKIGMIKSNSC